ncbi:MAG: aminotransferase class V-fold PLP-dependent enzyme [Rhizobiales bacterium]|nr:aminotransferase class V-fold PLP-dependent enzyme [Hyphomicrobiales bacterium]MBO6697850.1 aminotransferase class V-fold PLP-dependent enzyme [Hyphomicrobiales bacterium]MBO6735895.1 aminotransferase class V-fold PLP-dependent enzyme [Hyphomicrobiales bacterium]MBO6913907.1 aminotransferase class V-fold PLP-dependent enzyme [Hyphomicrobiales bacterium]MBO6955610.1 aminotransferase class V-fold PLP-dependent enzyme [Hyphomicrobiales bacterium]
MTDPSNRKPSLATRVAQALHFVEDETGAVVPGIQPAATYARDENYDIRKPYWYRRDGSQTTAHAEAVIAELEGAKESLLFASGMSAATAVIEHLPTGAHVVAPEVMYHGVRMQLLAYEANGRITLSSYTAGNLDELAAAVRPGETQLVWVETPNNPNWEVTDIQAAADIAHGAGAKLITDCTGTPPNITRALDFGADISFHSATKYLGGHSDVTAGVLSVRETGGEGGFWDEIALIRKLQGTVLQSFDAWLLVRGMRTLFLRVEKASANAMAIAKHFDGHPALDAVLYPGLPSDPGHAVAKRQTSGLFGGMLSIIVKGSEQAAIDVCRFTEVFYPATSLGGVESLIEHRKTVSGEGFPVHPRLLRLSIGIEDADDLIYDLEQALARAGAGGEAST